ncbi:ATP-binding protein [Tepidibacillus marianensis]|uniref:ATP-binding protein n=1 Tax=Tepidibacillus marianensis TaxID=3131995 RepID=UPI0030D5C08B
MSTTKKITPNIVGQKIYQMEVNRALLGSRSETVRIDEKTGNRIKFLAIPIHHDQNVLGAVFMTASMEDVYRTVYRINNILVTATLIALLFTATLGFLLSRTIIRPIKDITKQAVAITKGNFTQAVKIYGEDEIGRLGFTFNQMAKKLKDAIDQNQEEREKLSSILTHMSDGVIATNDQGKILVVNHGALELLGLVAEQTLGYNLSEIFPQIIFPIHEENLIYQYMNDQDTKLLNMTLNQIHHIHQEEISLIIVLRDVTKEQKLEQIRKDFVANVSHELRTPLTTLKSYLEALDEGAIEDPQLAHHFIKVTRYETDRMIRLVTDLLQLSRSDERNITLNKSLVSMKEIVEDVMDRFAFQAKQRSIQLTMDMPDYLPTIQLDRDQMDQVLDNLVSNAIKYTSDHGKVNIHVRLKQNRLSIEVSDTGIGIPKKHLSRLFERFYRVDKARSRELGGTGLGLSIAKEIVKAHQGEIQIESEVGIGTKVTFVIPINTEVGDSQ